jgi:hypothetical protein
METDLSTSLWRERHHATHSKEQSEKEKMKIQCRKALKKMSSSSSLFSNLDTEQILDNASLISETESYKEEGRYHNLATTYNNSFLLTFDAFLLYNFVLHILQLIERNGTWETPWLWGI